MTVHKFLLQKYTDNLMEYISQIDFDDIHKLAMLIKQTSDCGKRIYIIGNGGSLATSIHFAEDLLWGNNLNINSYYLTNISTITAIANDEKYEDIYLEQLKKLMKEGDLLICISCSGNSRNLIKAIDYANKLGETIGICGFNGGYLKDACNHSIHIKTEIGDYETTEDVHLIICHMISRLMKDLWD